MTNKTLSCCIQNGSKELGNNKYWVLFSGGKDSTAVAYYLQEQDKLEGILTLDTGINIPDYLDWVKMIAKKRKWKLHISRGGFNTGNEKVKSYEEFVKTYGFPKPGSHSWIMRVLKGRGLSKFKRLHKGQGNLNPKQPPFIASGARQKESKRRMGLGNLKTKVEEYGEFEHLKCWNPIYDWDSKTVWKFLKQYDLEVSPSYKTLHLSGDCLCGAFSKVEETSIIEMFYPELANRLKNLEDEIKGDPKIPQNCKYWGYQKGQGFSVKYDKLDSFLCNECDINSESE